MHIKLQGKMWRVKDAKGKTLAFRRTFQEARIVRKQLLRGEL